MRWINVVLATMILVIPVWAGQSDAKFSFDSARAQLAQAMSQPPAEEPPPQTPPQAPVGEKLVPGKALLLSAILPGAGQYYAHSPIMAGVFLALEVGAWTGVALYHSKGMNKQDEFQRYAQDHWTYFEGDQSYISGNFQSYLDYEYYSASQFGKDGDATTTGDLYGGGITDWEQLPWGPSSGDDKLDFLPQDGFTHELDPTQIDQQYYEMIGKYNQFGAGWPGDGDNPVTGYTNYRTQPHQNWHWEATNTYREAYLNMRKDSNDALDMSKNFTMVVLANHLASALHAGFAVTWHNRRMAKEHQIQGMLHFEPRQVNGEQVSMAGLRVQF